jgi:hypothetical protein
MFLGKQEPYGSTFLSTSPHPAHIYNKMAISEWRKEYNSKNREKHNEWNKKSIDKWHKANKLRVNISTTICNLLKERGSYKRDKSEKILGCTWDEFKQHIESQFEPWMNWDNYGGKKVTTLDTTWDIDHIIPVSSAKTCNDILKLNHYTNLRPLCAYTNRFIKRDHI